MPSTISRQQIFDLWLRCERNDRFERILDLFLGNISLGSKSEINLEKLKIFVRTYIKGIIS